MTIRNRVGLIAILAASLSTTVLAEPAAPRTGAAPAGAAAEPSADALNAQDREALAAAEQLATDASRVLDRWIVSQSISEDRLFSRFYYPIPKTDPLKFSTSWDSAADRDLVPIEDKQFARSIGFQYAIVTDINGYVPAHNSKYAQPLTGNYAQDYANNRSKRMLGDLASIAAARSEAHFLIQRTRTDSGEVIYDVSVPVVVRGKHWGCARVGYRRAE